MTNTWFEREKRRRHTWKSPGERRGRFQIGYILVKQRYRNSVKIRDLIQELIVNQIIT